MEKLESLRGKPSEAETRMASALLKIRSDSCAHSSSSNGGTVNALGQGEGPNRSLRSSASSSTRTEEAESSPVVSPPPVRGLSRSCVATTIEHATILPHQEYASITNRLELNQLSLLSVRQLAALQAAVAVGAANTFDSTVSQSSLALEGVLRSGLYPQDSLRLTPRASWESSSSPWSNMAASMALKREQEATASATAAAKIRKDEVEAALHSKPQRGRKRENLNQMERLELTRTRNREHAKCTRIRKKQRYQELLDQEQRLQDFLFNEQLDAGRRATVLAFLEIRGSMLCAMAASTESPNESLASDKTTRVSRAFDILSDIVNDVATFVFNSDRALITKSPFEADARMAAFDRAIVDRNLREFDVSLLSSLKYDIKGASNGIALSGSNVGFAEVDLVGQLQPKLDVITSLVKFDFAPDSVKLLAVSWSFQKFRNNAIERLNDQISHPSVVSLDPISQEAMLDRRSVIGLSPKRREVERRGPGMDI